MSGDDALAVAAAVQQTPAKWRCRIGPQHESVSNKLVSRAATIPVREVTDPRQCFSPERFQMSRAAPQIRDVAERLVAYETREIKSAGTNRQAEFLVGEKLPSQLATLLGNVAVRALLSRALALASAEVPWLRAVHVNADGSFEGLSELGAHDADEIAEGRVVVLAQLLGLLVAFIGDELTLRLVREAWPKLLLRNSDLGKGGKR